MHPTQRTENIAGRNHLFVKQIHLFLHNGRGKWPQLINNWLQYKSAVFQLFRGYTMLALYLIVGMVPTNVYACFNQVSLCLLYMKKVKVFPSRGLEDCLSPSKSNHSSHLSTTRPQLQEELTDRSYPSNSKKFSGARDSLRFDWYKNKIWWTKF